MAKPKIDFTDPNWAQSYIANYGTVGNTNNGFGDASSQEPIKGLQGYSEKNPDGTWNIYDQQGNLIQANKGENSFLSDIGPGLALLGGGALGMNLLAGALGGAGGAASGFGSTGAGAQAIGEGGWGALGQAPAGSALGNAAAGTVGTFTPAEIAANAGAGAFGATNAAGGLGADALGTAAAGSGLAAGTGLTGAAGAGTLNGLTSAVVPGAVASSLLPGISNGQLLATAAPLVGGLLSSNAASSAADKQAQATADSNALLKYMYDNNVALNKPAMDAGNTARTSLMQQLGLSGDPNSAGYGSMAKTFTGADLQNDPGYQFGLNQGQRQLDQRAANSGGYFSGAALKAAQRYGQDYAGTKFNDAFNRDQTNKTTGYNQLAGLTGGGQIATNQITGQGNTYAGQVGSNLQNNANAQGAAGIAGSNAWGNALTQAMNGYNNYNAANSMRGGLYTNWGQNPWGT